ncbi:MAG TPA: hypothetical protein VFU57_06440 [Candidatus Acidoferrales bacterium]|nr:hypothetical protein [Candidatus Acidoferrales bacterium]
MPDEVTAFRQPAPGSPRHRLDSWKEIAAYLNYSERTVRRWEAEGLPVHRRAHKRRAAIYAYRDEIDAWWNGGRARLEQAERLEAERPGTGRATGRPAHGVAILSVSALIVAAALIFALSRHSLRTPASASPVGMHYLAVLPLENLSRDPEQEYFAEGMTDELISDLAQIRLLRVISRNSIMQYKSRRVPASQIVSELHVDALVEGTVLRSGNRVRITAQLVDGKSGGNLWAHSYERDTRDVLGLQDEVARAIAREVEIKLTPEEQRLLGTSHPVSPAGHEAYLRGLYEMHGFSAEPDDNLKQRSLQSAIGFFQQALSEDPNDARAYAGLADTYRNMSTSFNAPLDVMPKARAAALKAIQLDNSIAEAHAALGSVAFVFDWDWPRAQSELQKAIELDPSLPQAHAYYAEYLLMIAGRPDECIAEFQRAYALDPLLPFAHGDLAWFQFLARRYNDSIATAKKMPNDDHVLALSYAALGQRDNAVAAANRALTYTTNPTNLFQIAAALAMAGKKDSARSLISRGQTLAQRGYVCGFNVAAAYSQLGEKDQAFEWLNRAVLARSD